MKAAVAIKPGTPVIYFGRKYVVRRVLDLDTVLAAEHETGELQTLKIHDLSLAETDKKPGSHEDMANIDKDDLAEAEYRLKAIQPLLDKVVTKKLAMECADKAGVHVATIYRWLSAYRTAGTLTSLLPTKREGGKGKSRLKDEVEAIMRDTIIEYYLTKQRKSVKKTCREVIRRCRAAGFRGPHENTIRNRIASVSEAEKLKKRHGRKAAEKKTAPLLDSFPGADWPLAFVQIDHTKLDIMVVDDVHRLPVGRPFLTLAIDVFSRCVVGFYVSLDPVGSGSTGLCIAHAILPKENWLAKLGIETPWPVWGVMRNLHADNAKEFRGDMLRLACLEYGINLHWRPVAKPRYGAHIERLLGTFNKDIHSLPGTTFSNIREREEYDSEGHAIFTMSEFETWLTKYIVEVYHQKMHSSLKTSPIEKFKKGILGEDGKLGIGLPERITNEEKLRLDFMPCIQRTIQNYGVLLDYIQYYSDILRPWINTIEEETGKKRKFIFRRDPRDISAIYFNDPEVQEWYTIPYRNTAHPPMSVWELREIQRRLKEAGQKDINEDMIFEAYEDLREMERNATRETKRARSMRQRRTEHAKAVPPKTSPPPASITGTPPVDLGDLKPFEELEEWSDE